MTVQRLVEFARDVLDRSDVRLEPAPGGAQHHAFTVLASSGSSETVVGFLRAEADDRGSEDSRYGLQREAAVLECAARLGLPVARVLGTLDTPPALLMEFVAGTSRPRPAEVETVAAEYMALVARLHELDASRFPIEQFDTVAPAVEADLAWWMDRARAAGVVDAPAVRIGHEVLRRTMPVMPGRPSVVHGDIGPGNFMVDRGRVTAMLDWELTHVGDPLEDLAWLWIRGAHTDFGDPLDRFDEYAAAAGHDVDRARVGWHLAFVMWKSVVGVAASVARRDADPGDLLRVVLSLTYEALLASQLAALVGQPLPLLEQTPEPRRTGESRLCELVLGNPALSRVEQLSLEYLQTSARNAQWASRNLDADERTLLGESMFAAIDRIDRLDDERLGALIIVWGRAADRAALASPKAARRIQRAQRIGLGTAVSPGALLAARGEGRHVDRPEGTRC